jgi:hypothetical protein
MILRRSVLKSLLLAATNAPGEKETLLRTARCLAPSLNLDEKRVNISAVSRSEAEEMHTLPAECSRISAVERKEHVS